MRQWTETERECQSALIQNWQPWKLSTGAKTAKGRSTSSQNALKHGMRSRANIEQFKRLRACVKDAEAALERVKTPTKAQAVGADGLLTQAADFD